MPEPGVDWFRFQQCRNNMPQEPGDRLKAYVIAQLQRAIACLGWRGSRAHSGVHQARKSLRRTRACLALGESALGAGAGMIDRELSKVCDSLSTLRDAQARVESLERLIDHHADSEMQTCLQAARRLAIQARAEAMRQEQSLDPQFLSRHERLKVLAAAIPVLPWEQICSAGLMRAMQHSILDCEKAADTALSKGKEKDWHRLRRRRRRLVQQLMALENSKIELPEVIAPDKKIGSLLGEAQDLTLLLSFFKKNHGLSVDDAMQLRKFLKTEFRHLSSQAMAGK